MFTYYAFAYNYFDSVIWVWGLPECSSLWTCQVSRYEPEDRAVPELCIWHGVDLSLSFSLSLSLSSHKGMDMNRDSSKNAGIECVDQQ